MKTILSLKRRRYLTRVGVFLIAIALIVGTVSCAGDGGGGGGGGGVTYTLTMAEAPPAGGTATDLTGASPYAANTVVNIQAAANPGYNFSSWSAPAGSFGNAALATTTFTMPAQNVIVTANFALAPGYYSLTMAANPGAGGTATDLTGGSPYTNGTVVNIQAAANPCYQFVNWTSSDGGTFGNATAATTNFTMPAQSVTVTANFVYVCFTLTMAVAPPGSGTATDLTGGSPYTAGTVVSIQAAANPGYQFSNWTSSAGGTFGNATAATTTFTMPAQDVTVTANFASAPTGPLDHFKWYLADNVTELSVDEPVYLEDQFGAFNATVEYAAGFGNPAVKWHDGNVTPISNPDHHLAAYYITCEEETQTYQVEVKNQFVTQELTVSGPIALLLPTQKVVPGGHQPPVNLDHYLLYEVLEGDYVDEVVSLKDQFDDEPQEAFVDWPMYFANPVQKTYKGNVTEIVNSETHLVFYAINASFSGQVDIVNQFGEQTLDVYTLFGYGGIAVPSEKLAPPVPPLDHFKCYNVMDAPPLVDVYVYLEDQFTWYDAQVLEADWFCNPVEKSVMGIPWPIVNEDNHLTVYNITPDYQDYWYVEVDNQFGYQELTVYGPVALAAPTWKFYPGEHGPPKYLDHYLLYEVMYGLPVNVPVELDDEFPLTTGVVDVTLPRYFANPVAKYNYDTGTYTGVWDPKAHLVFYDISGNPEFLSWVEVDNQFEYQSLNLTPLEQLLAVPSQKLYYEYGSP